jgi:hypothetical protein
MLVTFLIWTSCTFLGLTVAGWIADNTGKENDSE